MANIPRSSSGKLASVMEKPTDTDPNAAMANPSVKLGLRPTRRLSAESPAAPAATPAVPRVPGIPDRLVDPVICSDTSVDTVTTAMYAVEMMAFPENRTPVSLVLVLE
jgi:hypothetical protein